MVEGEPHVPESLSSSSMPPVERGAERFTLRRILIGAAIGAIALPVLTLGVSSLAGVFSNVSPSEVSALISVGALQVVAGAVTGGLIAARRVNL